MKRFLAILVCVVLMLSLASPVFAVERNSALQSSATTLHRGDTFTVDAIVTNSEAVKSGTVRLEFNTDVLELTGGTCHLNDAFIKQVIPEESAGMFVYMSATVVSGKLFTFQFKVKDDAPFGSYEIKNITGLTVTVGETIDSTGATVTVECTHTYGDWEMLDGAEHGRTCSVPGCGDVDEAPHVFDQTVATDAYKASGATCTEQATYYYSCVCGKKGTETFLHGELAAHVYDKTVATDAYKASGTTCTEQATYYKSCVCGAAGTETFAYGELADHTYGQWEKVDETTHKRVCTNPDCLDEDEAGHAFGTELAKDENGHYYLCACGEKKDEAEHTFGEELISDENGHYYLCACGQKKDEAEHTFNEKVWESDADNHWHSCECGVHSQAQAHNYDAGKVTKEPSASEEGVKTFTCQDCGAVKTEQLAKLETPPTGDTEVIFWGLLAISSALAAAFLLLRKKTALF